MRSELLVNSGLPLFNLGDLGQLTVDVIESDSGEHDAFDELLDVFEGEGAGHGGEFLLLEGNRDHGGVSCQVQLLLECVLGSGKRPKRVDLHSSHALDLLVSLLDLLDVLKSLAVFVVGHEVKQTDTALEKQTIYTKHMHYDCFPLLSRSFVGFILVHDLYDAIHTPFGKMLALYSEAATGSTATDEQVG